MAGTVCNGIRGTDRQGEKDMNNEDRNAIAALAARFFEKSDDLIAVSGNIEELILRRKALSEKRDRPPVNRSPLVGGRKPLDVSFEEL